MNNYFVILAAGKSKRFDKKLAKQFYNYKNKEIIDHSVEKSLNSKLFKKIIIVTNNTNHLKKKKYPKQISIIKGGKERSDSSLIALKFVKKFKPTNVLIHDAARPNFTIKLLKNLVNSLKKNKATVPVIFSKDSIKYKFKNLKLWNRGVDTDLFNPKKRNRFDQDIRLTYIGRVAIEKNIKEFLNIKGNYKKTVVGDGPELKKYINKYPDIEFVGLKTGDELAKYYADADVFVFPSKTDTLGNVILESLASGTPVAAFPVTGPKDILTDTEINTLDNNLEISIQKALKIKREDCRNFALKLTWEKCTEQYLSYMIDAKTGQPII